MYAPPTNRVLSLAFRNRRPAILLSPRRLRTRLSPSTALRPTRVPTLTPCSCPTTQYQRRSAWFRRAGKEICRYRKGRDREALYCHGRDVGRQLLADVQMETGRLKMADGIMRGTIVAKGRSVCWNILTKSKHTNTRTKKLTGVRILLHKNVSARAWGGAQGLQLTRHSASFLT